MNDEYQLRSIDYDIINTKSPDSFIDMLNVSAYSAGDFGGKIPVMRHRLIFEKWLEKRDKAMKLEGAKAAERIIRMSPEPTVDFRKYIKELEV